MSVYDELQDLYNFDGIEEFNPVIKKETFTIENESYCGYSFTTPQGKEVFTHKAKSKYHENGQQMGNPWSLYSVTDGKYLIIGRKTKKQIIEEAGRL